MDQQDGMSLGEFMGQPTAPSGSTAPTSQPDMLSYANQQLASGKSPDQAMQDTFTKYPTDEGVSFTLSPDGKSFVDNSKVNAPMSVQEFAGTKEDTAPDFSHVTGGSEVHPESWSDKLSSFTEQWVKNKQADTAQAIGNIESYFHNYEQKHQVVDGGPITTQQRAAAKLLGFDMGDFPIWGPIYKMNPDDRDQMDQKFQESLGLHPQQTKERLEKTTGTNLSEFDPYGKVLNDSLVTHAISQIANPELANSRRYHEVQDMIQNMDAVEHPEKYNKDFVTYSANKILAYKKQNDTGVTGNLKQQWQDIKKNPVGEAKAMAGGIASEPELLLAPEAKLGSFVAGGREAASVGAQASASRLAGLAKGVSGAAKDMPSVAASAEAVANVYGRVASRAANAAKIAKAQRVIGNVAGATAAGAGINAASSAADQFATQGFVSPHTIPTAAVEGAAFGGIASAFARGEQPHPINEGQLKEDLSYRAQPRPSVPSESPASNVNAGRESGQPLHPDTTVSKDGNVPYFGGIDADMDRIHHHRDAPEQVSVTRTKGGNVDIPIKQTVGYHEAVEGPLLHLEGPVSEDTITELQRRIGPNHTLPPETLRKLRAGESLVYTNPDHEDTDPGGHEIATWAENHMVETLYGVKAKDYQDALKPAIKKVGKASQKPGAHEDIPDTLDTKPYDDVGQSEQLKGKGERPTVDQVEPGAEENEDNKQKGKIDPRLLATGAVVGGGTAIGAGTQDNKEAGALTGGLTGLALSSLFWGGDIGARGKYLKEGGMFVGPKSRTWKGTDSQMAERMEKIGKTPDEINLATGMHRNAAGQWTGELSDKNVSFIPSDHPNWERAKKEPIPLSTVMNHDKLDEAYPGLSDKVNIKIDPDLRELGRFSPDTNTITLRKIPTDKIAFMANGRKFSGASIVMHELQHVIQDIEGFPQGSNSQHQLAKLQFVKEYLEGRQNDIFMRMLEEEKKGTFEGETARRLEDQYEKIQQQLMSNYSRAGMIEGANLDYIRQAGEVQARNTQERMGMTEQERMEKAPGRTQDVDTDKQLIKMLQSQLRGKNIEISTLEDLENLKDNYNKPLSNYSKEVYHESNVEEGTKLLPHSNFYGEHPILYTSNTPELAIGQKGKNGVLIKLDADKLNGQINKNKPTWEYSWKNNQAEFISQGLTRNQIQDAVKEVTFKKGSRATAPAAMKARANLTINNMVREGWKKIEHSNGDITVVKPEYPIEAFRSKYRQTGSIDYDTLKKLARAATVGTVGAMVGANLDQDHSVRGALAGATLGVLLGPLLTDFVTHPIESVRNITGNLKDAVNTSPKENINDSINHWQESGLKGEVMVYRVQKAMTRLAPTEASQNRITHWIEGDKSIKLTPKEQQAAKIQQEFDKQLGEWALKEGVLKDLIDNHISHIWKNDEKLKAYRDLMNSTITANMSPNTAFAEARRLKTIAQGKAMGLTPVTENASRITGIYAKSVLQAIRNKQLLTALKNTKDSAGNSYLVQPARKAPINYVPINHPQLRGLAVHPTIAPELRNVFHTYDLGPIQTVLGTLNMALKRSEVSFSLFHLTSLMDAFTGGMPTFTKPVSTLGAAVKSTFGKSDFHKALEGKADPATQQLFDRFIASGARPQIPKGTGADVDVNNDYYEGLRHVQDYLDRVIPGSGKLSSGIAKVSHFMDHIIFENGMSGMKFSLWMHAVDKMNASWSKELRKNPDLQIPKQDEIDKMAGSYVNNLLGAQNWIQAAQQATTRFGRAYLNALGSPSGRKLSQYMLYAPDWTTSTVMSLTKAFGKGSGIKGLNNPKTVADLHRIYQIRSALLYALIGNAINYAYSGHMLWDNKDPTTIDLGNGQRLQWNKHWLEPYQMAMRPAQTVINKMGIYPRELIEQLLGKEYINVSGYSPPMKDRLAHLAKAAVPIPFQGLTDQTPQQLMWNMAGRNVLGHPTTGPEGEKYKEQKHKERSEAAKKAAASRTEKRNRELYGS